MNLDFNEMNQIEETSPISSSKNKDENFHYYYNREERLAKAPQIVQDFYANGGKYKTKGFFKFMFEKKSTRFLFLALVVVCAFSFVAKFLESKTVPKFIGTTIEFSVFSIDEKVYPRLKLNSVKNKDSLPQKEIQVEVTFKAIESSGNVCDEKKTSGFFSGDEMFLGAIFSDYDIIAVSVEIEAMGEKKELISKVIRQ